MTIPDNYSWVQMKQDLRDITDERIEELGDRFYEEGVKDQYDIPFIYYVALNHIGKWEEYKASRDRDRDQVKEGRT